jgi:amidohydrolase
MASIAGEVKVEVSSSVESQRDELIEMSQYIHANPELGFKEKVASALLCDYLQQHGFKVQKNIARLPTAFKATYGSGKPVVALLAEYDALPVLGHACGHNIIGVTACGAGVASRCAVDRFGGTVVVMGTPAEELAGGKINLVKKNAFTGLDAALILHPGSKNVAVVEALACIGLEVEFHGRAAHAAGYPEMGVNALEAMILSYNAVNSLRQHINERARIHGVITNGGEAANVVPDFSSASFLIRSDTGEYLEELKIKVLACFEGAAVSTGTTLKYKWGEHVYEPMKNNYFLAALFSANMESLGRKMEPLNSNYGFGSTDMGNVSQILPAIHPSIAITGADVHAHTVEFCAAAVSAAGNAGLIDGAKALAMTVTDILAEPANMASIREEFGRSSD